MIGIEMIMNGKIELIRNNNETGYYYIYNY